MERPELDRFLVDAVVVVEESEAATNGLKEVLNNTTLFEACFTDLPEDGTPLEEEVYRRVHELTTSDHADRLYRTWFGIT